MLCVQHSAEGAIKPLCFFADEDFRLYLDFSFTQWAARWAVLPTRFHQEPGFRYGLGQFSPRLLATQRRQTGSLGSHLRFELGWSGLAAFLTLAGLALGRAAKAAWRGQVLAWPLLAGMCGLFGMGLFVSVLEWPRLAMLLLGLMLMAVAPPWVAHAKIRKRTRRNRSRSDPAASAGGI